MSNKDTSTMSEQDNEKRTLVPQLRFPEFREAGNWEIKKLNIPRRMCYLFPASWGALIK
jgi:type I restriction enzyme S subunit